MPAITERTLRKWRTDALKEKSAIALFKTSGLSMDSPASNVRNIEELYLRILRMTQELLDQHLLRKE